MRAALVLSGEVRHALVCSGCGAPLLNLKMLPREAPEVRETARPALSHMPTLRTFPGKPAKPVKKKTKRKASRWGGLFKDAFDIIEDILD